MSQESMPRILERIQGEFREMPGLRLTRAQAARLWALSPPQCNELLDRLAGTGFLRETQDGAFVWRESDNLESAHRKRRVS